MSRIAIYDMSVHVIAPDGFNGRTRNSRFFLGKLETEFAEEKFTKHGDTLTPFATQLTARELLAEFHDDLQEIDSDDQLSEKGRDDRARNLAKHFQNRLQTLLDDLVPTLNSKLRAEKKVQEALGKDPLHPAAAAEIRALIREMTPPERSRFVREEIAAGNRAVAQAVAQTPAAALMGVDKDTADTLKSEAITAFADPKDIAAAKVMDQALRATYGTVRAAQAAVAKLAMDSPPDWTGPAEYLPDNDGLLGSEDAPQGGSPAPQTQDQAAAAQAAAALG